MSAQSGAAPVAGWSVLLLAGFAASLSLVNAGQSVGYQHLVAWSELPARPIALAIIGVQTLATLFGLRRQATAVVSAARAALPGWRLPFLLLMMAGSSAIVGRDLARFGGEMLLATALQLVSLGTLWLAVTSIPRQTLTSLQTRVTRWLGEEIPYGDDLAPRLDGFAWKTAACATLIAATLSLVVYGAHPHLMDEVAYLFQARTFASGRITLPNPPAPDAFRLYLIDSGPHGWYSPVPPGWGAAMIPGVWLGAPWLVNPLLTGVNVLLTYLVLQPLYGRRAARLAAVLLAASPWNLFLGMSFMPHAVTLTCALAAALGVMTTRRTSQVRWAWLGGLALGVIASVRQLDAMIVAAALGLWSIGLGGRRIRFGGTVGLVVGSMISTLPLLAFNRYFTGKPGTFPMMHYIDAIYGKGANDYGFGANRGMGWALDPNPGHGPIDGLINAALNTTTTHTELFGWSIGSLLFVYALVLRGRLQRADRAMLAVIALTWLAYFFNYFSGGPDFGARYWYMMLVPLIALTVRGVMSLSPSVSASQSPATPSSMLSIHTTQLLSAVALLSVASLVTFVPWRSIDKYWHYRGMEAIAFEGAAPTGRALVMVTGRDVPDHASASLSNPIDLTDDVPVYVKRLTPAADSATIAAFPDRSIWFVDGPTLTSHGFVVRAGPVSRDAALARVATPVVVTPAKAADRAPARNP